jgi:fused signal recognition particle receptor
MAFWRKNKDKGDAGHEGAQDVAEGQDSPLHGPLSPQDRTAPVPANLLDIDAPQVAADAPLTEDAGGWFSRLSRGLSKSTAKFTDNLSDLVTKRKLDQDMLDQLEDVLITADLGPKTAAAVVADFSEGRFGKDMDEGEIRAALAQSVAGILRGVAKPLPLITPDTGPMVILVCGVNGVGKTTTIGKIAYNLSRRQGRKVMMAAGDTFRAAAGEQLEIWANRAQCGLLRKETGADAAAVAFESYQQAKAEGADILLIDTAGRLHNKQNLMEELQKIVRVLKKHDAALPHAVLLVLDATTGQNALEQVRIFSDMVNVTGLAVTKLDGSAKGGVVVALADLYKLPIHLVGVGEGEEDLRPFDPGDYARSLLGVQ